MTRDYNWDARSDITCDASKDAYLCKAFANNNGHIAETWFSGYFPRNGGKLHNLMNYQRCSCWYDQYLGIIFYFILYFFCQSTREQMLCICWCYCECISNIGLMTMVYKKRHILTTWKPDILGKGLWVNDTIF